MPSRISGDSSGCLKWCVPISGNHQLPTLLELCPYYYARLNNEYDWRDFGPAPETMEWSYHSFDPPEKLAWDSGKTRYREITFPAGTTEFYKPNFDPTAAGWKTGLAPFGATNGKLETNQGNCPYDFCRHGEPMKTLWEKEVLLLKGKFKFPALKDGHRYRLIIGGMSHVGAGEGFRVYVNGKLFHEQKRAVDRREGAKPIGGHIHRDWWGDFNGGETEIAFISFMGGKQGWQNRHLMIWIQEMKLPSIGEREILESVSAKPMTSQDWQALQDLDRNDLDPEAGKFEWDGKFQSNPSLTGAWKTIGFIESLEKFDPGKPQEANRAPVQELTFHSDGKTNDPLWLWSGNTLMNLRKNEALEIRLGKRDDTEFIFIQAGGFETKKGNTWKSPWFVMKRP